MRTTLSKKRAWRLTLPSPLVEHGTSLDVMIFSQNPDLTPEELDELLSTPGGLPGDFNGDGVLDALDINDLTAQSASQLNRTEYDLNGDMLVDTQDVNVWVKDLFKSWIGDANLDDEFNSGDLVEVLSAGAYEVDVDAFWTSGDFNGDGRANSSDLVVALSDGGYEQGPLGAVASVPEPSSLVLVLLGLFGAAGRLRREVGR